MNFIICYIVFGINLKFKLIFNFGQKYPFKQKDIFENKNNEGYFSYLEIYIKICLVQMNFTIFYKIYLQILESVFGLNENFIKFISNSNFLILWN